MEPPFRLKKISPRLLLRLAYTCNNDSSLGWLVSVVLTDSSLGWLIPVVLTNSTLCWLISVVLTDSSLVGLSCSTY